MHGSPVGLRGRPLGSRERLEQLSHLTLADKRMAQRLLGLDLVVIAAPPPLSQHIPILDQLGENLVGAALGDADRGSDVAQANTGIPGDAEQDVGMVRKEVPSRRRRGWGRYWLIYISRKIIHE